MSDFVSRGGIKLQAALDQFQVDVNGQVVLDVGSSTGGFVDCLLQNGAKRVYAVDTAYGELAWKLRNDPRVVVMERTNILHLSSLPFASVIARSKATKQSSSEDNPTQIATGPSDPRNDSIKVDLITIDAGWTKLEMVLPAVKKFLKPDRIIIALLKPHYETDKTNLVKGVVRPESVKSVKDEVIKKIQDLGFKIDDQMESPILGGAGNKEYLLSLQFLI